jgi:hypothetical protein
MSSARSNDRTSTLEAFFGVLDDFRNEKAIFLVLPQTLRPFTAEQLQ